MRLSAKSRFAVTAMIDMGLREQHGPVSLAAISARQNISISYLEQMFSKMRVAGLVESTRGPGGGYTLSRDAKAISVADIIMAVNDTPSKRDLDAGSEDGQILTDALWSSLNKKIEDHMKSITLASLIAEQIANGVRVTQRTVAHRGIFAKEPATKPIKTTAPNSVFALGANWVGST
jgi:Rrf2 family transcriptional regulator, iron-sulfur cluster assembly transcription factor